MATTEQVRDRYWLCRARGECLHCRKPAAINPRTGDPMVFCATHLQQARDAELARKRRQGVQPRLYRVGPRVRVNGVYPRLRAS